MKRFMRNVKIKIIESTDDNLFEEKVDKFLKDVLVADIKDQTYSYASHGASIPTVVNRVLIYYKDKG